MRREPDREAGFLYVEVLVGLVILGVGLLAIVPMFVMASHSGASAIDRTTGTMLALEKAEELRGTAYAALSAGTVTETLEVRGINYRLTSVVSDDTPHPGMKTVLVRVVPLREYRLGSFGTAEVSFYHVP